MLFCILCVLIKLDGWPCIGKERETCIGYCQLTVDSLLLISQAMRHNTKSEFHRTEGTTIRKKRMSIVNQRENSSQNKNLR